MNITRNLTPANFSRGRGGQRIRAIVIHVMEGSMSGTRSWFRNPVSKVSAHYGVSRAGEVEQWVDDADTAQHAGLRVRTTAPLVIEMGEVNPNRYTIGIEFEGTGLLEGTAEQLRAGGELLAELGRRHSVPLDTRHVIPHRAIRADKTCPGKISVEELLRLAVPEEVDPRRPQPGDVRFSDYMGERVVLTEYVADDDYKFLPVSQLRGLGRPGSARWSQLRKI